MRGSISENWNRYFAVEQVPRGSVSRGSTQAYIVRRWPFFAGPSSVPCTEPGTGRWATETPHKPILVWRRSGAAVIGMPCQGADRRGEVYEPSLPAPAHLWVSTPSLVFRSRVTLNPGIRIDVARQRR